MYAGGERVWYRPMRPAFNYPGSIPAVVLEPWHGQIRIALLAGGGESGYREIDVAPDRLVPRVAAQTIDYPDLWSEDEAW